MGYVAPIYRNSHSVLWQVNSISPAPVCKVEKALGPSIRLVRVRTPSGVQTAHACGAGPSGGIGIRAKAVLDEEQLQVRVLPWLQI